MTEPRSKLQFVIACCAVALIIGLAIKGIILNGVSQEQLSRIWSNMAARPDGPMAFRFILQPVMAAAAAYRDGSRDARLGADPYLTAIAANPHSRIDRLWEGVTSTGRILILGVGMDLFYQGVFLREFFPAEAAILAVLLAFVPYVLLRGPIARAVKIIWRTQ